MSTTKTVLTVLAFIFIYGLAGRLDYEAAAMAGGLQQDDELHLACMCALVDPTTPRRTPARNASASVLVALNESGQPGNDAAYTVLRCVVF